jgi:hypothetical protein
MRLLILWALLFVAANYGLTLVHIALFQSSWPFAAWASIALHILGLLFFPYARVFTTQNPE